MLSTPDSLTFVDGDHWVVRDQLRSPTEHRYEARWHLPAEAEGHTTLSRVGRGLTVVSAPGVAIEVADQVGSVHIEAGWVSPSYGVKLPAPVVVITAHGGDVDIRTVVRPVGEPCSPA